VLLTADDLRAFRDSGYLVVPGVVDEGLLRLADDEVEELMSTEPAHDGDGGLGQSTWFMPRNRLPRCEDALLRSDAIAIAEQLAAPNRLEFAFDHIQVATTRSPWAHVPGGPHIDGHAPGQDAPASFTLLAGVLLTDQHQPHCGNLWVWPGSHLAHQRLFQQRGTNVLQSTSGHATALEPPLALPDPIPVLGGRGDLVLAHFLLGHNKGGNLAPTTRRTIYYRLAASGHRQRWDQTFLDAWTEYPPIKNL
jgi:ectoine hydroxylase-related dioxygenase (phytanoyl-CoA dioxygenase family)